MPLQRHVAAYKQIRPVYEAYAEALEAILKGAVRSLGLSALVETRPKTVASFAEKCVRKPKADPLSEYTDLCGGRVVADNHAGIAPMCAWITKNFDIDAGNSEDVLERLGAGEFGYRSVHWIVMLKRDRAAAQIGPWLEARGRISELALFTDGPRPRAEVQVRTLLQHAWAVFHHDRIYKGGFRVPRVHDRASKRIAAVLEDADEGFVRTIAAVERYRTAYGAWMSVEGRKDELGRVEAVADVLGPTDPDAERIAVQRARLLRSLGRGDEAANVLETFVLQRPTTALDAAIARVEAARADMAPGAAADREEAEMALLECRDPRAGELYREYGRCLPSATALPFLRRAVSVAPEHLEGWTVLGAKYAEANDRRAAAAAYERALQVDATDPEAVAGFLYEKACWDRNVSAATLLRHEVESAADLCRERARAGVYLPHAWFDIGLFMLLLDRPYDSIGAWARGVLYAAAAPAIDAEVSRLDVLRSQLPHGAVPALGWVERFLRIARLAALWRLDAQQVPRMVAEIGAPTVLAEPVVIVAGSCDPAFPADRWRPFLESGFQDFSGTVLGGGSTAGVCGIIGDLPGRFARISWWPRRTPIGVRQHPAWEVHQSGGDTFGPPDVLATWEHILRAGIDPARVRVLGVGGGRISALEYRIGLAMGARVAVVGSSGRAAEEILADADWKDTAGLSNMPEDAVTLRVYLNGVPRSAIEEAEIVARKGHEQYLEARLRRGTGVDQSLQPWDNLPEYLKDSNRHRVDYWLARWPERGYRLGSGAPPQPRLRFCSAHLEEMAEEEHGRWMAERLALGWRLGRPPKNEAAKTHPDLVPWSELADAVRDYDRIGVQGLADELARLGYRIDPPAGCGCAPEPDGEGK